MKAGIDFNLSEEVSQVLDLGPHSTVCHFDVREGELVIEISHKIDTQRWIQVLIPAATLRSLNDAMRMNLRRN